MKDKFKLGMAIAGAILGIISFIFSYIEYRKSSESQKARETKPDAKKAPPRNTAGHTDSLAKARAAKADLAKKRKEEAEAEQAASELIDESLKSEKNEKEELHD